MTSTLQLTTSICRPTQSQVWLHAL